MNFQVKGMKSRTHEMCVVLTVLIMSGSLVTYAGTADSNDISTPPEEIQFLLGESTVIKAPWPVERINITDPTIANAEALDYNPKQLFLQGTKAGSTDLICWNQDESQLKKWKIRVLLDTASLKAKLDEMFPDASLEVSQSDGSFVVKGLLRRTEQAEQLQQVLAASKIPYIDMTSLAGVQQVQLEIRVAEVGRTGLRLFGFNSTPLVGSNYFVASRTGGSTGPIIDGVNIGLPSGQAWDASPLPFEYTGDIEASSAITLFAGFPKEDFEFFLQALIENQTVRLLANPTLVALSGEQASFLVGGEYPIPVIQSSQSQAITIQYKEYGVNLTFEPEVLGDGTIRLHAAPEVSSLSNVGAVTIGGFSVPALTTRRSETTLELKNGQSFAMAGLLQHEDQATDSSIPGLAALPILGPLFKSIRYQKKETELVILVTASLVEPMSLASAPPMPGFMHKEPNDWEFFIQGRVEGKEPAKINADHAEWLRRMGLDKLTGPGAWDSYGTPRSSDQAKPVSVPKKETISEKPGMQTNGIEEKIEVENEGS